MTETSIARDVNPRDIARAMERNCAAYDAGAIDRARWDTEQQRLWKMAADAGVASVVLKIVAPGGRS